MTPISLPLDQILDLLFPRCPESAVSQTKIPEIPPTEEGEFFPACPLTLRLKTGEEKSVIEGVADGILKQVDTYTVLETVSAQNPADAVSLRERSLIRGKFLALALANTKKIPQVRLLLAVEIEGREEWETFVLEKSALSGELSPLLGKILTLAGFFRPCQTKVKFPHSSLRDGQKKLIHAAWNAIGTGTKLFSCAPTGIGKTLAVLYPALRALEKGKADKVFYAAPKNTLKMQAAAAVTSLQEEGRFRTLVLSAKMTLCPRRAEECEWESCPYAENFGEKLISALSYLSSLSLIGEKELRHAGETFGICPFELALKLFPYCQIIIGDYNHIIDPSRAVFAPKKTHLLLVDEAHNLPGRIRESFTETLSPEDLDFFFREDDEVCKMLREHLSPLSVQFAAIDQKRNETKEYFSLEAPEKMAEAAKSVLPKITFALHGGFGALSEECETKLWELFRKLKRFGALYRMFDRTFATVYPPEGGLRIYLVDPREKIRESVKKFRSTLFFSATLLPRDYYFDLLAGEEEDEFLDLPSPFPRDNFFVGICPVDVSYQKRLEAAPKLCSILHSAVSQKAGNYLIFLPSFEYLGVVSQEYKRRFWEHRLLIQKKNMNYAQRKEFLEAFQTNRKDTLIGFCVLGGIFAEGIDLKGDALLGEVIVGTGFPPPSPESEAESASYYKRELDGKSLAYTLPGWSRVLQASGRVIRSEDDRGFVLLCDTRYLGEDIKELFPSSWEDAVLLERDGDLTRALNDFWK